MDQMERRMKLGRQFSMNLARHKSTDPIWPIMRLVDGENPINDHFNLWFPGDQDELTEAGANQIDPLLACYGLPVVGDLPLKKDLLKDFLGIIL